MRIIRFLRPDTTTGEHWRFGFSWPKPSVDWIDCWLVLACMTPWFGAFVRRDGVVGVYLGDFGIYMGTERNLPTGWEG